MEPGRTHVPCHPRRIRRALAILAYAIALALPAALAQVIDTTLWVTNGPVYAVARGGGSTYIGGQFSRVGGPATGAGIPFDSTSGAPAGSFPKIAGIAFAVASDGTGGWYVGGYFGAVGGLPRRNLRLTARERTLHARVALVR